MNTTINDITRQQNKQVQRASVKGRLQKKVVRPYELEYFFELIEVYPKNGMPIETQVGLTIQNRGEVDDKIIYGYADTVDEAIDLYRQFCGTMNTQPDPDTEEYLRGRVDRRAQNVCLLIVERLIEIG